MEVGMGWSGVRGAAAVVFVGEEGEMAGLVGVEAVGRSVSGPGSGY